MLDVVLKRFDVPDEVRTFEKGRFELVHLGGMTIGRATYEAGWKWSEHATAAMDNGPVTEMRAGDLFYIPPGHDSWVIGDGQYVSLHLMGASDYARRK